MKAPRHNQLSDANPSERMQRHRPASPRLIPYEDWERRRREEQGNGMRTVYREPLEAL